MKSVLIPREQLRVAEALLAKLGEQRHAEIEAAALRKGFLNILETHRAWLQGMRDQTAEWESQLQSVMAEVPQHRGTALEIQTEFGALGQHLDHLERRIDGLGEDLGELFGYEDMSSEEIVRRLSKGLGDFWERARHDEENVGNGVVGLGRQTRSLVGGIEALRALKQYG